MNVLYIVVLYRFNVVFVITIGKLCQLATKPKPILTGPFERFPALTALIGSLVICCDWSDAITSPLSH